MPEARYDAVADFYATAFNAIDDPAGAAQLDLVGSPAGLRILDLACGHGRYYDEGRWTPEAELSALRRQVGAQHRTLSSYLNAFRRHGLWLDELREPVPASQWADSRPGADRVPVYLAGRCLKVRLPADESASSPRCAAGAAG